MKLLKLISFLTLITYNSAVPQPDTNIQIQHYEGPVYLSTPPTCCPFCNSIIKPQENGKEVKEQAPAIVYPQPYGNTYENEPLEIIIAVDTKDEKLPYGNDKNNKALGNCNLGKPKENPGSLLHNDKSIYNIPVPCKPIGSYGNTGTGLCQFGTGIQNTHPEAGIFETNIFGQGKPLSNFLPINTATQNTCQVPMLTYNGNVKSDEPVLVPQKFMYSLILDGEVGSNQNGCDRRMFYY